MDQNLFFSRNAGLISAEGQKLLADACVLIAGAGGDGGLLAERLARTGIGHLILADPEVFEETNINRQYAANEISLGENKASAVAKELALINPGLKITVCTKGITKENVSVLVQMADLLVDEIEYTLPCVSVLLHKAARQQGKHVFMGANIGWGASVFCFAPEGITFEQHFSYDEQKGTIDPWAYVRERPSYLSQDFVASVLDGELPMPAVAASVSLVAAVLTCEITCFLTGSKKPVKLPRYISIDLFDLLINSN